MSWDPIVFYEQLQSQSLTRARPTTVLAHPRDQRLAASQIHEFLSSMGTLAMATITPGGLPHLTTNHYAVHEGVFWLPAMPDTVRLQGLQYVPYASLMISEGQASYYTMVVAEGPLQVVETPPPDALDTYIEKLGDASWAAAWVAVHPNRLFSYQGENGRYALGLGQGLLEAMFS